MKREIYGSIYLSGNVMLPLEEAHKIQAILARHGAKIDAVYRGGDEESVHYLSHNDIPEVRVLTTIPHITVDGLTSKQRSAWYEAVRDSKGGDYLSPQDFIKLSEEPK